MRNSIGIRIRFIAIKTDDDDKQLQSAYERGINNNASPAIGNNAKATKCFDFEIVLVIEI